MNKLNILNLATSDDGGAGLASRSLNQLLIKAGFNSILLVKETKNTDVLSIRNNSVRYSPSYMLNRLRNRYEKRLRNFKIGRLNSKYCFFNTNESTKQASVDLILEKTPFKPDIIILHWVTNFVNSDTVKALSTITGAKIYWLMMDNAALTGGCHYPWECKGYQTDCADCPAIIDPKKKAQAKINLSIIKENLPSTTEILACSESDYIRATMASCYRDKKIHKILIPIDENVYIPGNKISSKSHFNIPINKKVIFYGSISLKDKRKGGLYFLNAIKILQERLIGLDERLDDYVILLAGTEAKASFDNIDIPIMEVGFLNEHDLIKAYQAADVFCSTSIEDSGPLMINQAIMCGTPVVAFEMGVALDLVRTGESGYCAKIMDCEDLAQGLQCILTLNPNNYIKLANNCRSLALKLLAPQTFSTLIQKIFNNQDAN